jgi:hypothetical protein
MTSEEAPGARPVRTAGSFCVHVRTVTKENVDILVTRTTTVRVRALGLAFHI